MFVLIVTLYFLCKGVNYGIRRLSEICFGSGIVLMLVVLLLDNTVFLLNLYVQSLGFYLQNLVKLGFHTDAFEQVGVFTRPLLQKGSSLQEEILSVGLSVDLFVRHHFFLLRIFNDLMV